MAIIKELLQQQAQQYNRKDFMIIPESREYLSYAQLADTAMGLGRRLLELNAGKGDRVAILLPNCKEFVFSYFGSMAIGCIAAPVNLKLKPEEIKYILTDMEPNVIITSSDKVREI
jgi:acyl-CoA synthetase (AMP-forming)/AMP-acid ligase II